jgi:hypothetical protein
MGGGGQLDSSISAASMTAIYTTFAIVGFMAGTFLNYFGAKVTLGLGGLGYAIYSGAYLCYNHTKNEGFVLFAGVLLGICAAFIWCAHGTVMMVCRTLGTSSFLANMGLHPLMQESFSRIQRSRKREDILDCFGRSSTLEQCLDL